MAYLIALTYHVDIGTLQSPTRLPNGALRVDGYIARAGVLEYRLPDGSMRRELRTDEENARVAAQWQDAVLTLGHPPVAVTPHNVRDYSVGHVGATVADGGRLRAPLVIQDAAAIAAAESGVQQLSCGYHCDLDMTPGEIDGVRYDAIQRNVRPNHVAIVRVGRAGPECGLKMDAAVELDAVPTPKGKIVKITVDGIEFEFAEPAGQAVVKVLAERDAERARADVAEQKAEEAEKSRADAMAPAALQARIDQRVALQAAAQTHLPKETAIVNMSDREIKVAVVTALGGARKGAPLTNADSDAVVDTWFNARLDQAEAATQAAGAVRTGTTPDPTQAVTHKDEKTLRAEQAEWSRTAWKNPAANGDK